MKKIYIWRKARRGKMFVYIWTLTCVILLLCSLVTLDIYTTTHDRHEDHDASNDDRNQQSRTGRNRKLCNIMEKKITGYTWSTSDNNVRNFCKFD